MNSLLETIESWVRFFPMMEWIIESASSFAYQIDFIITFIAILTGFWLFLAEGILIYFVIKFSKKRNPTAQYITGEKKEEMKWIHLPHNAVLVCDIFVIIFAIHVWYGIKQDLPKAEETVRIIGQQWSWVVVHPGLDKQLDTDDDVVMVDELRLKVGTTYHYKLEAKDVMHSFSIPVFRLKQDAIPGRVITGWFKPTKEGTYDLQCAEMCGIGHGIMGGRVVVQSPSDHNSWLTSKAKI